MDTHPYGFGCTLKGSLDEVRPKVEAALKEQGFGVLTEIDVSATLKKKLDVDFRPYVILGACNPPLAHRALTGDRQVGLLLPCNVVLQQSEQAGHTDVSVIDPNKMFVVAGSAGLEDVAAEADRRLRAAVASLA